MTLPTLALTLACTGDQPPPTPTPAPTPAPPVELRFATYNLSFFRSQPGRLVRDLGDPDHAQARDAAAVLQAVDADVLLLNEFDRDADGEALRRFQDNFLAVGQRGQEPISYPYTYLPEVNTGLASGVDLNQDGTVGSQPGSQAYGDDALGFGLFPGQYGLVVLSRYPIDVDAVRTFRNTLWRDVPDAWLPDGFYSDEALDVLPLSSKTHADVPIDVDGHTVHFLVSHPTPPVFDGPEDRNGRRNHDEIVFWAGYVDAGPDAWHVDDDGNRGGLDGAPFVIAGDLNADPVDGDSSGDPVGQLLAHPRVDDSFAPASEGGVEQAQLQGGRNNQHQGDPAHDTADFNSATVGNVRVDYVLPSIELEVLDSGVYWPLTTDPMFEPIGVFPHPVSDHRPVWVDVRVGG